MSCGVRNLESQCLNLVWIFDLFPSLKEEKRREGGQEIVLLLFLCHKYTSSLFFFLFLLMWGLITYIIKKTIHIRSQVIYSHLHLFFLSTNQPTTFYFPLYKLSEGIKISLICIIQFYQLIFSFFFFFGFQFCFWVVQFIIVNLTLCSYTEAWLHFLCVLIKSR